LKIVIMVAPAALIAAFGVFYLRDSYEMLLAPGVPLEFRYASPEGPLMLRADSYRIEPREGLVRLERPRITDPDGVEVARAAYLRVRGIRLPLEQSRFEIAVSDLFVRIVRLPDGRLQIQEFLPEPAEPDRAIAYTLRIRGMRGDFVDQTGVRVWSQGFTTPLFALDAHGDEWIASADAALAGIGRADLRIRRVAGVGTLIEADTDRLEVARLLEHLRSTPEGREITPIRDLRARSLILTGPVRILLPEGDPVRIETQVQAFGTDVAFGDHVASRVSFEGFVTQDGANGVLLADRPGFESRFEGTLRWAERTQVAGRFTAAGANERVLPEIVASALPPEVSFRTGVWSGWVGYDDRTGIDLRGRFTGERLSYAGEILNRPSLDLQYGRELLAVQVMEGRWQGALVRGGVQLDFESRRLEGALVAPSLTLNPLAQRFGVPELTGTGSGSLIFTGTADRPRLEVRAMGDAAYRDPGTGRTFRGQFEAATRWEDETLRLSRLVLFGEPGLLAASGTVDPETGQMEIGVSGRGLIVQAFLPELRGTGAFEGRVAGTLGAPRAAGRLELFGGEVRGISVPIVVADIVADRSRWVASNVQAVSGATYVTGDFAMDVGTQGLLGTFAAEGVNLTELTDGLVAGIVDVTGGTIAGTLDQPRVVGFVTGQSLVAANVRIATAQGQFDTIGAQVRVRNAVMQAAGGTLEGEATYNVDTRTGEIAMDGQNLLLARIVPNAPASLGGRIDGTARIGVQGGALASAEGEGQIQDLTLNDTLIGSGPWQVTSDTRLIHASAQVGRLDRFLELVDFTYDTVTRAIEGEVVAFQVPLQDIYRVAERALDVRPETMVRLRTLEGIVNARAVIGGVLDDPTILVDVLDVDSIAFGAAPVGDIEAEVRRVGGVWEIERLVWTREVPVSPDLPAAPPSRLEVSGVVDERGDLFLDGEVSNFDLALLGLVDPALANLGGLADMAFTATGPTRSPVIAASLRASRYLAAPVPVPAAAPGAAPVEGTAGDPLADFTLVLDTLSIRESFTGAGGQLVGGIEATGMFVYRGVQAQLSAQVPFRYPFEVPGGDPVTGRIRVPTRPLASVAEFYRGLDETRTEGTIAGTIDVFGTIGDLRATGDLNAVASTIGLTGLETVIRDARVSLSFRERFLQLVASGASSAGGTVSAEARTELGNVGDLVRLVAAGTGLELLDAPVSGTVVLDELHIIERPLGGAVNVIASSTLGISGPLRSPLIQGVLALAQTDASVPALMPVGTRPLQTLINPRFDVVFAFDDVATLRTTLATLNVAGGGQIGGSLVRPEVAATLNADSGTIRLPFNRLRIEEGGTMRLAYQIGPAGETTASLVVDLEGRTRLTTLRFGEIPERYDVSVFMRGNLLEEGGLILTATSDPPDLASDRILALLGQTVVFEDLQLAERRIREALTGVALPAVFNPLTSPIAQALGLDYLEVEYNPFDQAILTFARALGPNLVVQGWRQILDPVGGQRTRWDLRLTYRLPTRRRFLDRLAFSVGFDQDRPWKIAVEYRQRF
jgi:hypothetical protein